MPFASPWAMVRADHGTSKRPRAAATGGSRRYWRCHRQATRHTFTPTRPRPPAMGPVAMKAAHRAVELGPRSAEAQAALGRAQFLFDWDFAAAERSVARAVALDPDYMPAYQAMAWLKSARGQSAPAIAAAQRALQLDPVNTARYTELAGVLALSGRNAEALREIERALQLD